jgi:hypothetical protein
MEDLNKENSSGISTGNPGAGLRIGASNLGWEELLALLYADDIILMARNRGGMELLLMVVMAWSRKWRMVLNTDKTVILSIGSNRLPEGGKDHKICEIAIGNAKFSQVDQSAYLGKTFNQQLSWNQESSLRIGRAYSQLDTLRNIKFHLGSRQALQVWRQWFTTSVAYGAEAVVYNTTTKERFNVLDRAAWRLCFGVDIGVNNAWFETMLGTSHPYTTTLIDIQKLKWWRKLEEAKHDTISSQMWWTTRMLADVTSKPIPHSSWFGESCRLLQSIGLDKIASGENSAAQDYAASSWEKLVKDKLLEKDRLLTIGRLERSSQRLTILRETLTGGNGGVRWNGEGEFFRWGNIGLSVADTLWWCKFRGGLLTGKGRSNSWSSEVKCRKCQSKEETMDHIIFHCGEMKGQRLTLLSKVESFFDHPREAMEYSALGEIDREEQILLTLGRDKKWETLKIGEFWRKVVMCWREYMEVFMECP